MHMTEVSGQRSPGKGLQVSPGQVGMLKGGAVGVGIPQVGSSAVGLDTIGS